MAWTRKLWEDSLLVKINKFLFCCFPLLSIEQNSFNEEALWGPHDEVTPRTLCDGEATLDLIVVGVIPLQLNVARIADLAEECLDGLRCVLWCCLLLCYAVEALVFH